MACVNGPVSMYKLQSYYKDSDSIEVPSCVYKLNSFYADSEGQADSEMNPELVALERRQEDILSRLAALSQQVDALTKSGIPVSSSSLSASTNLQAASLGDELPRKAPGVPVDIVIYASPSSPPLSVLVLSQLLSDKYKVLHASHTHSSVASVPENLRRVFSQSGDVRPRGDYDVIITLIWKDVVNGPCLLISPTHHSQICGEANVARYLARLLSPPYDHDIIAATHVDSWLDQSYKLANGNKKEKAAVLKSMNTSLGKQSYLTSELSLADIVLWSLIRQSSDLGSPPTNVSHWIKNCNNHLKFQTALKAL